MDTKIKWGFFCDTWIVKSIFNEAEKDQIILEEKRITPLIERIKNNFSDVKQNTEDGLKLIWDNKWIHIRRSNTEPIIRIYSEALSIGEAIKLVKSIKSLA